MDQAVTARYYAHLAPRALKPHRRLSALPGLVNTREHHIPKGVIGVIEPLGSFFGESLDNLAVAPARWIAGARPAVWGSWSSTTSCGRKRVRKSSAFARITDS